MSTSKTNISNKFSERVRHLRRDVMRMNQADFAREARVNRSYLSEIENGRVKPSEKIVERIEVLEKLNGVGKPSSVQEPNIDAFISHSGSNARTLLKQRREELGISLEEMARRTRFKADYIRSVENGTERDVDEKFLRKAAKIVTLNYDVLLGEAVRQASRGDFEEKVSTTFSEPSNARLIPVISWAHAGGAEAYEELPVDWQRQIGTECRDPKAFGLEIRGDSMEPKYLEGDVAIVSPSQEFNPGDLVVAKLRDNGVCFKVFNAPQGELYRLTSYNRVHLPLEIPRSGFHWIYPVYEVRRITMVKNANP